MSVLVSGVQAGTGPAPSPRLARAAHEFEGQLMKELLKPLTATDGLAGDADEAGSGSALGEFAAESLAEGISRQGGFGIADKVLGELSHLRNPPVSGMANGKLQANSRLRESR